VLWCGAGFAELGLCLSLSRLQLGFAPFTDVRFCADCCLSRRAAVDPLLTSATGRNWPKADVDAEVQDPRLMLRRFSITGDRHTGGQIVASGKKTIIIS